MKPIKYLLIFVAIFSLTFCILGCYTVLLHPKLEYADNAGDTGHVYVDHVDDCSQCHQGLIGSSPFIGLGAAAQFESWRFYYGSAWWFDSSMFGSYSGDSADDLPQARDNGRRRFAQPKDHYLPTATATVPAPAPVLTKSVASEGSGSSEPNVSSQNDSRRTVGRRRPDTSNSKKRSKSKRRKN